MSTLSAAEISNPADVLRWQAEQIQQGQYDLLGRVWVIVLADAAGGNLPAKAIRNVLGNRLEFYGYDGRSGNPLLPRIAATKDKGTLLLLDPFTRQDGAVGLPDIPDPTWEPPIPTAAQLAFDPSKQKKEKPYIPPRPAMIRQELAERARAMLKGTRYMVFGPVMQILVRPEGIPDGWILQCGGEVHSGRSMELIVNLDTGAAFLYGGRYQIHRPGGQ
ncbi:MAG TPA: hypothetical protein VKW06_10385 [Candidatus Angelobacter sp.]|nr:hypothetical protein [Candidatus Angelobacter sp.]